jgi:hypothetical protein
VLPINGFWWDLWLHVAHLFSFLCCVFGGVHDCVLLISFVFCVVFLVGSVTACCISLYFSVLCFWRGPLLHVAHPRFLVGFRDSVLLISLVFCVVFLVGSVTLCCSSLLLSVLYFWWGSWLRVAYLFIFLCCVFGGVRYSVLLISGFWWGSVTPCCSSL